MMRPSLRLTPWLVVPLLGAGLASSGCNETGFSDVFRTDVFQQNRRNELDLLVVIDNSCSMVEEQNNVASNFDVLIDTFATAEVNWRLGVTTTDVESDRFRGLLLGGDDEIILRGPDGQLDKVEYDREWVFTEGVALQLSPDSYSTTSNTIYANWCDSPSEYVEGSSGSPGVWNPACDGTSTTPPEPGTDEGPRTPRTRDLIVTEIMADAKGRDSLCEWFEITSLTDDTLDLGEVTLSDEGNNLVAFPSNARLAPYQAMVIGRSTDSNVNCGVPVDIAAEEGFSLLNRDPIIDADTEDGNERFAEMIAQGTQGTGIELGLESAKLSFEEPNYSDQNGSWLREDAALAILIVSDEDDVSPGSVDDYERYFKELKGSRAFRQDGWFTMNALVGTDPTQDPLDVSCESEAGVAYYASRYIELAARTGGISESICADDFQPILQNLGLTISGLDLTFELKERPTLDTLEVNLFEDQDENSLVQELIIDQDFTYDEETNSLVFTEEQLPPAEYYVTATYRPLATSSDAPSDGGGEQ